MIKSEATVDRLKVKLKQKRGARGCSRIDYFPTLKTAGFCVPSATN